MSEYLFSFDKLDQHVEKVGVDVRPQIDIKGDAMHIRDFYGEISERFPKLFEVLVHSPTEFQIKKPLVIPGKGKIEVPTFVITPMGPVFTFPRKLPMFESGFAWAEDQPGGINGVVVECMEILFGKYVKLRHRLRIGKVRELIFATKGVDSNGLIRERFAPGIPNGAGDIGIRWNDHASKPQYNCKIDIAAVAKQVIGQPGMPAPVTQPEFGVQVNLDVNNRDMGKPLESEDMKIILDYADTVFETQLLTMLNQRVG